MILFIDMDGVLVNFTGGILRKLGRDSNTVIRSKDLARELGLSVSQFWECQERDPNFWYNLDPYNESIRLINKLIESQLADSIYILTSPSLHPNCVNDKRRWLNRYLNYPKLSAEVIFTSEKYLLAGTDRILIDDTPNHIDKWIDNGGYGILFPQPWNDPGYKGLTVSCLNVESKIRDIMYAKRVHELQAEDLNKE